MLCCVACISISLLLCFFQSMMNVQLVSTTAMITHSASTRWEAIAAPASPATLAMAPSAKVGLLLHTIPNLHKSHKSCHVKSCVSGVLQGGWGDYAISGTCDHHQCKGYVLLLHMKCDLKKK